MTQDRIFGYKLGCHAYLTKPFDPEELLWIVKSLLMNLSFKNTIFTDASSHKSAFLYNLNSKEFTYREKTILNLVLKGMMNKEIAHELALSIRNVEKYVSRLLSKTGTRNRTELVQYFYEFHCKSINKGE
jgi:DNA-binding NarL/FixJ family response regulator